MASTIIYESTNSVNTHIIVHKYLRYTGFLVSILYIDCILHMNKTQTTVNRAASYGLIYVIPVVTWPRTLSGQTFQKMSARVQQVQWASEKKAIVFGYLRHGNISCLHTISQDWIFAAYISYILGSKQIYMYTFMYLLYYIHI